MKQVGYGLRWQLLLKKKWKRPSQIEIEIEIEIEVEIEIEIEPPQLIDESVPFNLYVHFFHLIKQWMDSMSKHFGTDSNVVCRDYRVSFLSFSNGFQQAYSIT